MTRCLMADIMSIHYIMLYNDCTRGDNKRSEIQPFLIFENKSCESCSESILLILDTC